MPNISDLDSLEYHLEANVRLLASLPIVMRAVNAVSMVMKCRRIQCLPSFLGGKIKHLSEAELEASWLSTRLSLRFARDVANNRPSGNPFGGG